MYSSTKLQYLRNSFTTITTQDNTQRTVLRDETEITPEIHAYLLEVLHNLSDNVGGFDLPYDIVSTAVNNIPSTIEEIDDFDESELYNTEFASVYTRDRLDYLTIQNQYDITQVLKETDAEDIATACAIWYNRTTSHTLYQLINFINL